MDVFQVHQQLLADYQAFTAGFTKIHDPRIREHVDQRMANGDQWPDAYLSLNPNFASGGSISELVKQGFLHPECERIYVSYVEAPVGAGSRLGVRSSYWAGALQPPAGSQLQLIYNELQDLEFVPAR